MRVNGSGGRVEGRNESEGDKRDENIESEKNEGDEGGDSETVIPRF